MTGSDPDRHDETHFGYQRVPVAEKARRVGERLRHGRAVNLDPASLILDTLHTIARHAG